MHAVMDYRDLGKNAWGACGCGWATRIWVLLPPEYPNPGTCRPGTRILAKNTQILVTRAPVPVPVSVLVLRPWLTSMIRN